VLTTGMGFALSSSRAQWAPLCPTNFRSLFK
jgi:hypothetical protein